MSSGFFVNWRRYIENVPLKINKLLETQFKLMSFLGKLTIFLSEILPIWFSHMELFPVSYIFTVYQLVPLWHLPRHVNFVASTVSWFSDSMFGVGGIHRCPKALGNSPPERYICTYKDAIPCFVVSALLPKFTFHIRSRGYLDIFCWTRGWLTEQLSSGSRSVPNIYIYLIK